MTDASGLVLALRTVAALAVVLVLLVVFMRWLERQTGRTRRTKGDATVPMSVMARLPLGKGTSVQVVRVGSQVLALGVTDHNVSVLTDLAPADLDQESAVVTRGPSVGAVASQNAAVTDIVTTLAKRQGRHRGDEPPGASGWADTRQTSEAPPDQPHTNTAHTNTANPGGDR